MDSLHRKALLGQMSSRPPRTPSGESATSAPRNKRSRRDFTPSSWEQYFDRKEDVTVGESNVFRVYHKGTEGAVLLLLHGGGLSALSFAVLTNDLSQMCNCRVAAVDLRGHGDSHTDDDYKLDIETLVCDVTDIVRAMYGSEPPPIVLMGHSMGGALAVRVAHSRSLPSLAGLIVIDVVEGTAMDALSAMQAFLRSQPKKFASLQGAIEWACRSGQIRNAESARISMPPRLSPASTGGHATQAEPTAEARSPVERAGQPLQGISETGASEAASSDEDMASSSSPSPSEDAVSDTASANEGSMPPPDILPQSVPPSSYVWRIDLTKTEPYWQGWFKGLSSYFLDSGVPSFLLLAGVDRLDKEMTIAHMQGKFQMQVLPEVGHCVHEDAPDKVADAVATFLVRYKLAARGENSRVPEQRSPFRM
ncbi:protein phosphatase methylesterase 1-like [Sycon ciliatum]|uniref:protein phosphatase methylesterase 1-like n=1 Tax=Sycon ciliatum TaxID=27933 RepID=UPI0031F696D0